MGIFFKVLARKHAVSMYFGSLLREPIDQVVALSQGDNQHIFGHLSSSNNKKIADCCPASRRQPSTFSIHLPSGDKDELRVVAVRHSDDPQLFISTFLLETRISCGSSPWGTATTLNFLVLKKCSPQLGIEPRTSLRQAEVLNNRLPRNHFNTVIMNVTIHKTGKLHVS